MPRVEVTGGHRTGSVAVNDGEWHHIAIVFAAGGNITSATIYVDGVEDTGGSSTSRAVDTASSIDVLIGKGAAGGATHFDGAIDDIRIYSRALTAQDINALVLLGDQGAILQPETHALTFPLNYSLTYGVN